MPSWLCAPPPLNSAPQTRLFCLGELASCAPRIAPAAESSSWSRTLITQSSSACRLCETLPSDAQSCAPPPCTMEVAQYKDGDMCCRALAAAPPICGPVLA